MNRILARPRPSFAADVDRRDYCASTVLILMEEDHAPTAAGGGGSVDHE
jgi:hypothetical protein